MAASLMPGLGVGSAKARARAKAEPAPRAKSQKMASQKVAGGGHSTIPQFLETHPAPECPMEVDAAVPAVPVAAPPAAAAPALVLVPASAPGPGPAPALAAAAAAAVAPVLSAASAPSAPASAPASPEGNKSAQLQQKAAGEAPPAPVHKDIDASHAQDVCYVVPYVQDIYAHNQRLEARMRPNSNYMEETQIDITPTMRGILVDWLVEVAEEYHLVPDSLYLSVAYIDRFLSQVSVVRSKLQLVGVTCMLLASKYEEIYAPQVRDFCFITDNTYKEKEVLQMEQRVLDTLEYNLTQPTVRFFLRRFLRAAIRGRSEHDHHSKLDSMASFLAELSLLDYGMVVFHPSQVAASAVMLALYVLEQPVWTATLEHYTGFRAGDLKDCVLALHRVYRTNRGSSLPAIREKYNKLRFKCVSSISPPALGPRLLDAFKRVTPPDAATNFAAKGRPNAAMGGNPPAAPGMKVQPRLEIYRQ
jgi:cyclin A